jgi:hypothetical protein
MRLPALLYYVMVVTSLGFCAREAAARPGTLVYREGPLHLCMERLSKMPELAGSSFVATKPKISTDPFQWKTAFKQSAFFTGTMHVFNMTEKGTRQALFQGHWLDHWGSSVSQLRGWEDSDSFATTYVGHPIEGGVFGFIQVHNDPRYRTVEWGSGRDYFISRLRALAYSAAWSTQWTLGPASEASIGNVQIHAQPGFDDLVVTPTLGVVLMIGEDIADRYLIIGLENSTANRVVLMFARSFLNPSRSWANLIEFQEPWHRDNRPGIFGANHVMREELVSEYKRGESDAPFGPVDPARRALMHEGENHTYPLAAPVELMVFANYESLFHEHSCVGGGGQGAARINLSFQIVAELNGCSFLKQPLYQSGDSVFYAAGLRWTPAATHRVSPYLQVLMGGRRMTQAIFNPKERELLKEEENNNQLSYLPFRSQWEIQYQANGFALTAGGGFDYVINRAVAWRVANVEYTRSMLPRVNTIDATRGVRVTSGMVLRVGTW